MTQKKTNSIVPQEYVDKMQEYNIDEWRKQRIADALKYQAERETGADVPVWWEGSKEDKYDSPKYGVWNNCLATATGAFGDKYCVTGNRSFIDPNSDKYFEKKGFRQLEENEQDEFGDLHQEFGYDGVDFYPSHMLMLTGEDENGKSIYTYGPGYRNDIQKNKHYPFSYHDKKRRYRFVGTPDEIAEIEAHNAKVKEFKEKTAPLHEKREVARLNVEPLKKSLMEESTERYLKKKKAFE